MVDFLFEKLPLSIPCDFMRISSPITGTKINTNLSHAYPKVVPFEQFKLLNYTYVVDVFF